MEYNNTINKLERIIKCSYGKSDELCMQAMCAYANLLYHYNQEMTNNTIEDRINKYALKYGRKLDDWSVKEKKVVFYDGFGLDTRGLYLIYLNALVNLGYDVVYITSITAKKNQPTLMKLFGDKIAIDYFDNTKTIKKQIDNTIRLFKKYGPEYVFSYTTPYDVSGVISVQSLKGKCKRLMINLTDHAFWIGVNACDYYIEFRDYGGQVSKEFRMIDSSKLIKLPYYPFVDKSIHFAGFPFDCKDKKIIFSGGALYKTIDNELTYYNMIRRILRNNNDVIFVYAGSGNSEHLSEVKKEYPGRVFYIPERTDLFEVMKHSTLYLSTYPLMGGLMLQYAIVAGVVPFTLLREKKKKGVLLNEENAYYYDVNEMLDDIDKALSNHDYLVKKYDTFKGLIITPDKFETILESIMEKGTSPLLFEEDEIDMDSFKAIYKDNFNKDIVVQTIARKYTNRLLPFFPIVFAKRFINK